MNRALRVLALLVATWSGATTAHAIPVVWGGNGHLYEVVLLPGASWDTARAAAQALGLGWDLATVTSAGEQAFIESLLGPPPVGGIIEYWIGGFQPPGSSGPGASWEWINGEGVFWNSGPVGSAFANWGSGEPNDLNNIEDNTENHLALDNRYLWGWNDNDPFLSNVIVGYVAESAVPEPASVTLLGLGLVGLAVYRRGSSRS